jgi:transposase-like protein
MLQGELESHLGYKKNALRPSKENARNGYISKRLKSEHGEVQIMCLEIGQVILSHN